MIKNDACCPGAASPEQPVHDSHENEVTEVIEVDEVDEVEEAKVDQHNSPITAPSLAKEIQLHQPCAMHQTEHFLRIKEMVKNAIAAHHTFMIYGRSRVVRECLLNRGWCEKLQKKAGPNIGEPQMGVHSNPSALLSGIGDLNERQNERLLISKMLTNHTVDFLWNAGSEWSGWPSQDNKTTIFNRFTRANFTSKVGLCSNVRQMHWYYEAGIANTLFPRCYNISQPDQLHAFIEDFRLTACLSLLKWLVDRVKSGGEEAVRASSGIVPLRALDFAIGRCSDFIGSKSHEDIDQELEKVWSHQWEQFIIWYYKLLHGHALFISNNVPIQKYLLAARHLLKKVKKYWPQLDMDGTMNIWILKPGNKSRGRGIVLMNKLDDILAKVNPTNKSTDTRFVIQKYIERPLLIYDTKFDIRQWFIVTNAQPLTLWMYRESYLRFCSQKFSLTDFHESIHLSNNAVQCKYKNSPDRDANLPSENMWDVATFKEYLKCRGDGDAWDELIYPGMKQGLVGSLLASQEAMDRRKNSFELYGADFMVMEDFSVWLIEINSHPDMSSSTSVTTRLCRRAMEDTIKVVVDHRDNPSADTGAFELVYKQKLSSCQAYLGTGLSLHGTRIAFGEKNINSGCTTSAATGLTKRRTALTADIQEPNVRVGPVLVDLIEELELQLDHEFYQYLKLRSASGLSRQILPLGPATREPTIDLTNRPDSQRCDIETNTLTNNINLLLCSEQATSLAQRNVVAKLTRSSGKASANKRSAKRKISASQGKANEAPVAPQVAKTLMSKIIDLQKETSQNKSLGNTTHFYRSTKAPGNLVSRNAPTEAGENSMKDQKFDKKIQGNINSKIIPTFPNTLVPSSKEKNIKSSSPPKSAVEGNKPNRKTRRSRGINSQVFVDVTDMYAVGLAVNK